MLRLSEHTDARTGAGARVGARLVDRARRLAARARQRRRLGHRRAAARHREPRPCARDRPRVRRAGARRTGAGRAARTSRRAQPCCCAVPTRLEESAHEPTRSRRSPFASAGCPLALDQAGAFIEQTRSSPDEYLRIFESEAAGAACRPDAGGGSVAATLSLAFDRLRREDAGGGGPAAAVRVPRARRDPRGDLHQSGNCCVGEPLGDRARAARSGRLQGHPQRDPLRPARPRPQAHATAERPPAGPDRARGRVVRSPSANLGERTPAAAVAAAFPAFPEYSNWPLCERLDATRARVRRAPASDSGSSSRSSAGC